MKKVIALFTLVQFSIFSSAQSITLGTENEYCPNFEYEFSVTLPGPYKSISATTMAITQQPTSFNQEGTSFKFKAKFSDVNVKQFVEIIYRLNNVDVPFKPEFKRVKSLFHHNIKLSNGYSQLKNL